MKYMLIKELYDCFYTPQKLSAPRQEKEECHKALIEVLETPECRLVLQIIDAKDRIAEDTSIDSFISGFELEWQLSVELNNYKNERLASCRTGRLGARFVSQKEHHKEETTCEINYGEWRIKKNTASAVEWLTKSAERGNQCAQYMLGKLYLTGKEVPYDEEQAVHWLTRSAEQDNRYAQYFLDHLEENRPPTAMLAVTRLLHHMSRVFRDNSVPKSRPGGIQIDRKRLKKLQEKRIALGHKPDDHEQQWPDMTM